MTFCPGWGFDDSDYGCNDNGLKEPPWNNTFVIKLGVNLSFFGEPRKLKAWKLTIVSDYDQSSVTMVLID